MIDEQQIEDKVFYETIEHLEGLTLSGGFDIASVEDELKTLEEYEGLDGEGRGPVKAAEIAGSITAYQAFIMRYKKRCRDVAL